MYLKHLELNGFKSFAKSTKLDFLYPITAVVGPNGSGKSNIAEAIQWVLGEQSLKSLRGKKGEDLIFAGSQSSPKLGRAMVAMTFDNTKKHFDVDFDEVVIERRVYRDGTNEYLLNGSKVRLKDIISVLANVGLGSSQHHIISQGESDKILYSSPKDRRGMIEDALGIKIYQLKRHESERKLEHTEENMRQVASLRKEIQPHLKFLRSQSEKASRAKEIRLLLKEKLLEYIGRESSYIEHQTKNIIIQKENPQKLLTKKEAEIANLREKLNKEEQGSEERKNFEEKLNVLKKEILNIQSERSQFERDLGRLEGMIEAQNEMLTHKEDFVASPEDIKKFLHETEIRLNEAINQKLVEKIHLILDGVLSSLRSILNDKSEKELPNTKELEIKKSKTEAILKEHAIKAKELQDKYQAMSSSVQESAKNLRGVEKSLYEVEMLAAKLRDQLRMIEFTEEKLKLRKDELKRDYEEGKHYFDGEKLQTYEEDFNGEVRDKLRREVERLKIKFEEAGGVDPSITKEFEDVRARDEFFERELLDLAKAATNLRKVIKDLEERLENDFKEGVVKINKEFQQFFETMFGGGRAELRIVKPKHIRKQQRDEDDLSNEREEDVEEKESGVDVIIDLPHKRIKSLDMLSGGERALSSIALLFALSSVNPPPFLVLDETDAALDEANSRRYGAMLDELAKNTQLIVITHNRESMSHASILYGVTMGRDSISRLISVKLDEAEQIAK